jgi:glycosyltransferase involved in cell wall biosynthesis
MPAESPRISVLMPAYNAQATIRQAVDSVLSQTVSEIELIVADDGSREPTAQVLGEVADARLQVVRRQRNGGVSAARNSALALARAPLIAQLDADDYWHPDHLEHLLASFEDPAIGLAYANTEIIGCPEADRRIAARAPDDGLPEWVGDSALQPVNDLGLLYGGNQMVASAVAMRTDAVRKIGGYSEWLHVGEEYLLYIRLMRAGWRFAYVDRPTAVYRWPEPGRGVTFDTRRNSREVTKLFAVLALTSAPNKAMYCRFAREVVGLAKAYAPMSLRRVAHGAVTQLRSL